MKGTMNSAGHGSSASAKNAGKKCGNGHGLAEGAARGNQRHEWQRLAHTRPTALICRHGENFIFDSINRLDRTDPKSQICSHAVGDCAQSFFASGLSWSSREAGESSPSIILEGNLPVGLGIWTKTPHDHTDTLASMKSDDTRVEQNRIRMLRRSFRIRDTIRSHVYGDSNLFDINR